MGTTRSAVFPARDETASEARHWSATTVEEWSWPGSVDKLMLLVSELVTNALLHASAGVRVTMYRHEDDLWVSVEDEGAGVVTRRHALPTATSGRGLEIVNEVSGSWGVLPEAEGKSVWFELPPT